MRDSFYLNSFIANMHIFYTPDITTDKHYTLSEDESKHALRVLRLKIGDTIQLIDGRGGLYIASIISDHVKKCTVEVTTVQQEFGKRNNYLHIAIAPTKSIDRIEWFAEKATEIGIDEISLLDCERSERGIVKTERINKVLVSAIKQSINAYLPKLNSVQKFEQFIKQNFEGEKYIAHCNATEVPLIHLKNKYSAGKNALILIGPEGDFSLQEVALAKQNGFIEISLGASRLRTETAALVACNVINVLNA